MIRPLSVPTTLALLIFTGCHVAQDSLPWFGANDPVYTEQQVAAMDPSSDVTLDPSALSESQNSSGTSVSTVSASKTTSPSANAQIEQLVQSGRVTIQQAGNNPVMLQQARGMFEQALQLDANHGAAHHGIAIVADLQQDWATAEAHYKHALSRDMQNPDLLNDLGYSYLLQNRFHEATQYLNQALQVSPRHERAHINLAMLSLKRNDVTGASNRLAMIYRPAEVQTTLGQLQNEIAKTNTTLTPSTAAAVAQPAMTAQQQQQQPGQQQQPANVSQPTTNPNFGQPQQTAQSVNGSQTAQWPRTSPQFGQQTPQQQQQQQQQFSTVQSQASANSSAAVEERPVSVYPPSVIAKNPELAQVLPSAPPAAATAQSGQNAVGLGVPRMPANNPGQMQSPNTPSAQPFNGVPVGGIISATNGGVPNSASMNGSAANASGMNGMATNGVGMNQQVPGQNILNSGLGANQLLLPNPGMNATASTQQPSMDSAAPNSATPILGLNTGPGTLFPIPAQPTTAAAPARIANAAQRGASAGLPQIPNGLTPSPANYGTAVPYGNGLPPLPSAQPPQPAAGMPNNSGGYYYGTQPAPNPVQTNGVPGHGVSGQQTGYPQAGTSAPSGAQLPGQQPYYQATANASIRGVSSSAGAQPVMTASNPGYPATGGTNAGSLVPSNLSAPSVPVATPPSAGRPGPLAAYEQQLRNLDQQYNATIQGMNGQQFPGSGQPTYQQ